MNLLCLSFNFKKCEKYTGKYEKVYTIHDVEGLNAVKLLEFVRKNMPMDVCVDNIHSREYLVFKINGIIPFRC